MTGVYSIAVLLMGVSSVLCITDEMREMAANLHKSCVEETGVDNALIDKVNTEKAFPDDAKLKCYVKCLMTETGIMSADGTVDIEATIAIMPEEIRNHAEPIIRACGTKVGADPCESAWLTHKCYLENDPAGYILI